MKTLPDKLRFNRYKTLVTLPINDNLNKSQRSESSK